METLDLMIPAGDLGAAVAYLRQRPEVDSNRIGVLGHSQGGWVAPLAASLTGDVSFVISLCGPGVSVLEQVLYQDSIVWLEHGLPVSMSRDAMNFARKLYTY